MLSLIVQPFTQVSYTIASRRTSSLYEFSGLFLLQNSPRRNKKKVPEGKALRRSL